MFQMGKRKTSNTKSKVVLFVFSACLHVWGERQISWLDPLIGRVLWSYFLQDLVNWPK